MNLRAAFELRDRELREAMEQTSPQWTTIRQGFEWRSRRQPELPPAGARPYGRVAVWGAVLAAGLVGIVVWLGIERGADPSLQSDSEGNGLGPALSQPAPGPASGAAESTPPRVRVIAWDASSLELELDDRAPGSSTYSISVRTSDGRTVASVERHASQTLRLQLEEVGPLQLVIETMIDWMDGSEPEVLERRTGRITRSADC